VTPLKADVPMNRKIIAFRQDDRLDWVADLECGHSQHVRHNPPWTVRPWVVTPEGRARFLGFELDCRKCDENLSTDSSRPGSLGFEQDSIRPPRR